MPTRRTLIATTIAAGAFALSRRLPAAAAEASGWPAPSAWAALREAVGGRLVEVEDPLAVCRSGIGDRCDARLAELQNPFFIEDQPGGYQTNGWLDAWTATPSPYAVAAERAEDIAAAVDFARTHGVRLAVKGTGHDYLGRSCAPGSLLVWTHRMRAIEVHDAFRIAGGADGEPGIPALTAGAGTRWIEAYQAAAAHGLYVQGGGCTSVGVAGGFIQGGGFGSLSKRFGTGAGNVLEYEVITADGEVRIANARVNPDLFFALRGGGGSTFGIVSKVTIRAHPLPQRLGVLQGEIRAADDAAMRELVARLVAFYPEALNNPTWGEQIAIRPENRVEIFMTFVDLTEAEAEAVWQPLVDALRENPDRFTVDLKADAYPMAGFWDAGYWQRTDPGFIVEDRRADAERGLFWWAVNQGEVAEFIDSYQSRWLPLARFAPDARADLVETLFASSRHAPLRLQINKGLAGAPAEVIAREAETSVNPVARDAAALVIIASRQKNAFPDVPGHAPDRSASRDAAAAINAAMAVLRTAWPESGAYGNECDYFEPDWQENIYGAHYPRLAAIKRKWDPDNLFHVHHGVGSERA